MALAVTEERVRAAAARLAEGGLRFTGRQLYYAVCRDVEVPRVRVAPAELSLGGMLLLVAMFAGAATKRPLVLVVIALVAVLVIAAGLVSHVAERRPPSDARPLALSFATFGARHLEGLDYPGLVADSASVEDDAAGPVLLCDRAETAALLRANRDQLGQAVLVTDTTSAIANLPARRCVVVHDSSPAGCALAPEMRERGVQVGDAGLNPADVMGRPAQVLEGAPARLPRDLNGHLAPPEVDWLRSGRRVELATLTPAEVLDRVRAALDRP